MRSKFTQSFKVQAVEKVLGRGEEERVDDVANALGVGLSTLQKWIRQSKEPGFEAPASTQLQTMTKEKRPQDWSAEDRLEIIVRCGSLDDEAISKLCREKGLYPH